MRLIAHSGKIELFRNPVNGCLTISLGYEGNNHRQMIYQPHEALIAEETFRLLCNRRKIIWH